MAYSIVVVVLEFEVLSFFKKRFNNYFQHSDDKWHVKENDTIIWEEICNKL